MEKAVQGSSSLEENERYYFASYANLSMHAVMLKDTVRTKGYIDAIMSNTYLFYNKIILDVGCGTGILAIAAARAGAAHVFGIEYSDIADQATKLIKSKQLDGRITIIKGKVEEVELPVKKVDIILCEWMGYCLFFENMLETVLYAKRKWLKDDGYVFPDKCKLYIAGVKDIKAERCSLSRWKELFDLDMTCLKDTVKNYPLVISVSPRQVVTSRCCIKDVNIYTIQEDELDFASPFHLRVSRKQQIDALVTYFEVGFTKCKNPSGFSTAPDHPNTHWKQTLFYMNNSLNLKKKEYLNGTFTLKRNADYNRDLDITIEVHFKGSLCQVHEKKNFAL